jgi:hypothetical protein
MAGDEQPVPTTTDDGTIKIGETSGRSPRPVD